LETQDSVQSEILEHFERLKKTGRRARNDWIVRALKLFYTLDFSFEKVHKKLDDLTKTTSISPKPIKTGAPHPNLKKSVEEGYTPSKEDVEGMLGFLMDSAFHDSEMEQELNKE
jgi:hypothetical protein